MTSITAFSELMYDPSYGSSAGHFTNRMETLQGPLDEPILLGLRPNGRLTVILPARDDGQTEWQAPIDIGAQWDTSTPATIKSFAVHQDADTLATSVALLISACPEGSSTPRDSLFLAEGLAPCDRTAWAGINDHGTMLRHFAESDGTVRSADLVTIVPLASAAAGFAVVVAGALADGTDAIVLFDKDADDGTWTRHEMQVPGAKPQALAGWQDLTPGWFPEPGFFCLTKDGAALRYAKLNAAGSDYASQGVVDLGTGPLIGAIAAVPPVAAQTGGTLYGGGNGIYRWSAEDIASGKPPTALIDGLETTDPGKARIAACLDTDATRSVAVVTFLHDSGDLYYARDALAGSLPSEAPVVVENGVSAAACIRSIPTLQDPSKHRHVIALAYAVGDVSVMEQDATSSNDPWVSQWVLVPAASGASEQLAYSTRVIVKGDAGTPVSLAPISVTASATCAAYVNGVYRRLPRDLPIQAMTGADGALTLVVPTKALESPTFTVQNIAQGHASIADEPTVIDPTASAITKLRALKTVEDFTEVRDCHGNPVFEKAPQDANNILAFLRQFLEQNDAATRSPDSDANASSASALCLRTTASGIELLQDDDARDALVNADSTTVSLATLLLALIASTGLKNKLIGLQRNAGGPYWFVLKVGENILLQAQWHFGSQTTPIALMWVIEHMAMLSPKSAVSWLGWIFDWKKIDKQQGAVRRLAELAIEHAELNVAQMIKEIDTAFDALIDGIATVGKMPSETFDSPFMKQKIGDLAPMNGNKVAPSFTPNLPSACMVLDKMLQGAHAHMFDLSTVPAASYGDFDGALEAMNAPMLLLGNQIAQALGDTGTDVAQMTLGEILRSALRMGVSDVRSALKLAFTALLEKFETLFGDALKHLAIKVDIQVLNYIWETKLERRTELQLIDFLSLGSVCTASVVGSAMGFSLFSDKQIDIINDPAHTTLLEVVAALQPVQQTVGSTSIKNLEYEWLPGAFEIIMGFGRLVSGPMTVLFDAYGQDADVSFHPWVSQLAEPMNVTTSKYTFGRLNLLKAAGDSWTCVFGTAYYAVEFQKSPYKARHWMILYGLWFGVQHIWYRFKDWYKVWTCYSFKTMPEFMDDKRVDLVMGVGGVLVVFGAYVLQITEPDVPVEIRGAFWASMATLSWAYASTTAFFLITVWMKSRGTLPNYLPGIRKGLLGARPFLIIARGWCDFVVSQTKARGVIVALNTVKDDVPQTTLSLFKANASGNATPSTVIQIRALESALPQLTGNASVRVQSANLPVPQFNAYVIAKTNNLIVFSNPPGLSDNYIQASLYASDLTPGRIHSGLDGLYVVDTAAKAVYVYDLPLDLTNPTASRRTVLSNLKSPTAVCTILLQQADSSAITSMRIADGASIDEYWIEYYGKVYEKSSISGLRTRLTQTQSLAIDPQTGNVVVADKIEGILVFAHSDSGDVAPMTQWTFNEPVTDLAVDQNGNVVYAHSASINKLPLATPSTHNPKPTSTITGRNTQLSVAAIALAE